MVTEKVKIMSSDDRSGVESFPAAATGSNQQVNDRIPGRLSTEIYREYHSFLPMSRNAH